MKSFVHSSRQVPSPLRDALVALALSAGACAPSAGTSEGREAAAIAAPSAALVMGFESTSLWSVQSGGATLSAGVAHIEGTQSLSVANVANSVTVQSAAILPPANVGPTLSVGLQLPSAVGWGQLQLFIDSPSRGIWSQYIGAQGLASVPAGTFQTFAFTLPAATVNALRAGNVADLKFRLSLNAPSAGPYLLDGLSFATQGTPQDDPNAPKGLKGYGKGGRDVALLWDGVKTVPVREYRVYRGGAVIGTAPPRPTGTFFQDSVTYVDATVVDGATYQYQVQTVLQDGSLSGLSAPAAVAYSSAGVPVPRVDVDASAAPDILSFLQQGPSLIQTWYPKIGNMLAQPEYQPPAAMTLSAFEASDGHPCLGTGWIAGDDGTVIEICAAEVRKHPNDVSVFVHESTHVVQSYLGYVPKSVTEGMASWAADLAMNYTQVPPPATELYTSGYGIASYFFSWLAAKGYVSGSISLLHDLNIAAHQDAFSYDLFKTATGRTIGQLWTELSGVTASTEGPLVNGGGRCLDLPFGRTADETPIGLHECWRTPYQAVVYHASGPGAATGTLEIAGKCVTAVGTAVQLQSCVGSLAQQWRPSAAWASATLTNVATNGCLQPEPNSAAASPLLVTGACTDATARWTLLP